MKSHPWFEEGMRAEASGDDVRARGLYLKASAAEPGNADVLRRLGTLLNRMGEPRKALPFLKKAVRLDPGEADGYAELGLAMHRLGFPKLAEQAYRACVALRPSAPVYSRLADVLWDERRLEEAVSALNTAVKLDSGFREAYISLGLLLRELRRPHEARVLLKAEP